MDVLMFQYLHGRAVSLKYPGYDFHRGSPKLMIPSDRSLFRTRIASVCYLTRFIAIHSITSPVPSNVFYSIRVSIYMRMCEERRREWKWKRGFWTSFSSLWHISYSDDLVCMQQKIHVTYRIKGLRIKTEYVTR